MAVPTTNQKKLTDLINKYPEKIIVFSAGNEKENLDSSQVYRALAKLFGLVVKLTSLSSLLFQPEVLVSKLYFTSKYLPRTQHFMLRSSRILHNFLSLVICFIYR